MMTSYEWAIPGLLGDLVDFVFRPVCLICRGPVETTGLNVIEGTERLICLRCDEKIIEVPEPSCRRCGSHGFLGRREDCGMCRRLPKEFGLMRSASLMKGVGGKIVHLFKYQGWKALAAHLALKVISSPWSDADFWDADLLLPVPISRVRRRERGYNQSDVLAEKISELIGIPVGREILERVSWRRPQVGLPYGERLRNVLNAFSVPEHASNVLSGRRVILVDDVITTGATIHACYQALKKGGARGVSCVSFGRAENPVGDQ